MEKVFQNIKQYLLIGFLFGFPLFFLTTTQEFFITNKIYFLSFGVLLLLFISGFQLLFSKKLVTSSRTLDLPIVLFIGSIILSLFLSSPNKIQALLSPNFGLLIFLTLGLLYFFLSRSVGVKKQLHNVVFFSALILSLLTILFFFQPFKNVSLPSAWQFLKNPNFTPLGNLIDLVLFLGFTAIYQIYQQITRKGALLNYLFIVLNLIALSLAFYLLVKNSLILPPLSLSWYAVLEILKSGKTALFGVGIDGFSQLFTRVKDLAYNQTSLWSIASFNVARNSIFHIFAEIGILGILSFAFLLFTAFKTAMGSNVKSIAWLLVYLLIGLFLVPPSLPMFFLLFVVFSFISNEEKSEKKDVELENYPFLYFGLFLILTAAIVAGGYFLGRSYAAEYYFKQATNGLVSNNAKEVYDNIKKARVLNPFEERFVLNFAQTNILIADSLARKEADKITETDRQTIAQAVQAAISEAKELVRLNPDKAGSYENLANVYRSIVPIANGADVWTISSYQRAIILDPSNPNYRLSLGGIYYLLGKYGDAAKLFEQAVTLKPDWPNAHYNLAWSYFQEQKYDQAALTMQNVVNLVNKKASPQDWEKANKDLEDFKNQLATFEQEATTGGQLNLPEQPVSELDPKLKLPPEASPEAQAE